jgi:hypothetical protein
MESGPFRAPQPVERRVASREAAPVRVAEEPEPVKEVPAPTRASYRAEPPEEAPEKQRRPRRRLFLPLIIIVAIIVIAVGGYLAYNKIQNSATGINTSEYQAVFFTNGQVYFGKLQSFNNQYLKLTDIFYLQAQSSSTSTDSTNPQSTSSDQSNNVQLIKLGNEVHGPEDEMVIARDQVLFYENLKPDGKVAQSIAKYKSN